MAGDGQLSLSALGQLGNTLVPALDDLALTNDTLEGLATVSQRVELLAVVKGTGVVNGDGVTGLGEGLTVTFLDDVDLGSGHCDSRGVKQPVGSELRGSTKYGGKHRVGEGWWWCSLAR